MNADRWLGLVFLLFAAALAFVWVPLDTETGLAEVVRRRLRPGDALGPTVAAAVIGLGALMVMLRPGQHGGLTAGHLRWLLLLLAIFAVSFAVMRWAGPLAVEIAGAGDYRALRATAPWMYIGYLLGGTLMVFGLHVAVARKAGPLALMVAVLATLALTLLYGLPFDDILLPPNGDF